MELIAVFSPLAKVMNVIYIESYMLISGHVCLCRSSSVNVTSLLDLQFIV